MGSKRGANTELTDRNWDREEEAEEAGTFQPADESKLKTRVIRTAKRRGTGVSSSPAKGAFTGFAGFGASSTTSTSQPSFNFGGVASIPSPVSAKPSFNFGLTTSVPEKTSVQETTIKTTSTMPTFSFGTTSNATSKPSLESQSSERTKTNGDAKLPSGNDDAKREKYLEHVKALNASVLAWISKHVTTEPTCVLTPVFSDYERHLKSIREKFGIDKKEKSPSEEVPSAKATVIPTKPSRNDEKLTESKPASSTTTTSVFAFGSSADKTGTGAPSFNFGSSAKTDAGPMSFGTPSSTFSFGKTSTAPAPFSFGTGNAIGNAASTKPDAGGGGATEAGDEDYVPPKPDVKEVNEDDAIYTKRCKLFYKKDSSFVDRGVGNLFVKPMSGSDTKFSLLIRADTNLGNVLLNISIKDLKFEAIGAKDVKFLCVPNPPIDPKMPSDAACVVLLRLKDAATRDEALEQLNTHN